MEKRHLFEVEQQQEALAEFNDLGRIKASVDWDRFTPILAETFGPPRTSGRRSCGIIGFSFVVFCWGSCMG